MTTECYSEGLKRWPADGQHIMASYDDEGVWVYQAFSPEIAQFAAMEQKFLGCSKYSATRMSWIKPGFLWMQYRSGWCSKPQQEHCLAIKIKRGFFKYLLDIMVGTRTDQTQSSSSKPDVLIQWDPDHDPAGEKCQRRAIQIGMRGETLMRFASGQEILEIHDITDFVVEQRKLVKNREKWRDLIVPVENEMEVL